MNRKTILLSLFWLLVFTGLTYFFFSFATFVFKRQEEMQIFIPTWDTFFSMLTAPGGLLKFLGQWLTQYYVYPLPAAIINATILCGTGIGCYLLLQKIKDTKYNILLALFPVIVLQKFHIQSKYVADGTLGLCFMLLAILLILYLKNRQIRLIVGLTGMMIIYWIAGQLVVLYGLLWVASEYLITPSRKSNVFILPLLLGIIVAYSGVYFAWMLPLTDGLHNKAYHDAQLQPDSLIYYVWIRLTVLIMLLQCTVKLLSLIKQGKRIRQYLISTVFVLCLFFCLGRFLPDRTDVQNRMLFRLEYLSQRQYWGVITAMHRGKKIPSAINLSYLNMALAKRGELGDRLFHFDQHGPEGLLALYDRTFLMGILLSDIHFMIGDISLSESYAMEALTGANRGGSPRALQRLVQINLLREEWELARKYLLILHQMPYYKGWAMHYETLLNNPEKIAVEPELRYKFFPSLDNTLHGLLDIETIWNNHIHDSSKNRVAFEYMGSAYLLAKQMDLFKALLLRTANNPTFHPLPLHFQEAAVMAFADDPVSMSLFLFDPSMKPKYAAYCELHEKVSQSHNNYSTLYQQFGNTFWYYYHYKELGK